MMIVLTKTSLMTGKKPQGMIILIAKSLAEIYHGSRVTLI